VRRANPALFSKAALTWATARSRIVCSDLKNRFDNYRCAIVNEPRGSDPLVGALLVKPHRADCDLGVIYFNNVGYLGMCGHGTIGLIASLKFAGQAHPGARSKSTPRSVPVRWNSHRWPASVWPTCVSYRRSPIGQCHGAGSRHWPR